MEKLQFTPILNIQKSGSSLKSIPNLKNVPKNDTFERSNSVSFTSKYIMDVNLKRRTTKKPIKAQVRELDFSPKDDKLMYNLETTWSQTFFMSPIFKSYFKRGNDKFYIVSTNNDDNLKSGDVKSIMQFKEVLKGGKKTCNVKFLQSAPEIADNEKSSIRGAGELALYAVVSHAKETGCKRVDLISTNNGFYENVGFEMGVKKNLTSVGQPFYLDEKDYDWFLSKTEKKYGIENK